MFDLNKENVIEDDAFDEVCQGYKLPSAYAASASWRRHSNQENLAKYARYESEERARVEREGKEDVSPNDGVGATAGLQVHHQNLLKSP